MNTSQFIPPIFVAHGGGPLPLLNDQSHQYLISELKQIPQQLKNQPKAILVISAHWEENQVTLLETLKPDLLFDYYGFPPQTYKYQYNVKPDVNVNLRIRKLFKDCGIDIKSDNQRGYDHGVFVPLLLMYPSANIPVSQISLCKSLDPEYHLKIGQILSPLTNEGVLILCSGMSFHNMQGFFNPNAKLIKQNDEFHKFIIDCLTDNQSNYEKRKNRFMDWKNQSNGSGVLCHPREEHFIPLLVSIGAAQENKANIKQFNIMNYNVINVIFDNLQK